MEHYDQFSSKIKKEWGKLVFRGSEKRTLSCHANTHLEEPAPSCAQTSSVGERVLVTKATAGSLVTAAACSPTPGGPAQGRPGRSQNDKLEWLDIPRGWRWVTQGLRAQALWQDGEPEAVMATRHNIGHSWTHHKQPGTVAGATGWVSTSLRDSPNIA